MSIKSLTKQAVVCLDFSELKVFQGLIGLGLFVPFAVFYLREPYLDY